MFLLDSFHNVQVTLQTDKVQNIPCGTSGGVLVNFEKVCAHCFCVRRFLRVGSIVFLCVLVLC
jgi:hypothetical protein